MKRHIRDSGWRTWTGVGILILFSLLLAVGLVSELRSGDAPLVGLAIYGTVTCFGFYVAARSPMLGLELREEELIGHQAFRNVSFGRREIVDVHVAPGLNPITRYNLVVTCRDGRSGKISLPGRRGTESEARLVLSLVVRWIDGGIDALPRVL